MNAIVYYSNGEREEYKNVTNIEDNRPGYDPIITYITKYSNCSNDVCRYVTHLLTGVSQILINM